MITKYTDKNQFGYYTYEIRIDCFFLKIHEAGIDKHLIELKEFKWVYMKTQLTFMSYKNLEVTIKDSLDRVFDYFYSRNDIVWTLDKKEKMKDEVLFMLNNYNNSFD